MTSVSERAAVDAYVFCYVVEFRKISTQSFNPSASPSFSLILMRKQAEGFCFQTLQDGSARIVWYMRAVDRTGNIPARIPTIQVIEYDDEGYITSIESYGNNTETDVSTPVYDVNGRQVGVMGKWNELPKGVYIANGKKLLK